MVMNIKFLPIVTALLLSTSAHSKQKLDIVAPEIYPFVFKEQKQIAGSLVKCINNSSTDFNVNITILPWARAIKEVSVGRFDAIMPTLLSEKRKAFLSYPDKPLFKFTDDVLIRNSNTPDIAIKEIPNNTIIGKLRSSPLSPYLKEQLTKQGITFYDVVDYQTLLKLLSVNKIDYFIGKETIILATADNLGLTENIKVKRFSVHSDNVYLAFSKEFANKHDINKIMTSIDCKL